MSRDPSRGPRGGPSARSLALLDATVAFGLVAFLALAALTTGPKMAAAFGPTPTPAPTPPPPPPPTPPPLCVADGICRSPENFRNCPADCPAPKGEVAGDVRMARPDYKAGDTVEAILPVRNTGTVPISTEQMTIEATVLALKDPVCNALLQRRPAEEKTRGRTVEVSTPIAPGETQEVKVSLETPREFSGCPLAGDYRVKVAVAVDTIPAGSRELQVTLG
ncbi:MAG: hypothetical protein QXT68_00995 [Halobacteria archaeon]